MIDPRDFADTQLELAGEFGKFVFDHPEVDEVLPPSSSICFEVAGEPEFNQYSRMLAERQHREEGVPVVLVRLKGLAPPQGSRFIDPVIEPMPAVA